MPKINRDIEQGSQEWLNTRKGRLTASNGQAIGANGKGLETYILNLMAEYYSSGEKVFYSNADMDRGNELEPIARDMYELEKGFEVEQVGYIEPDNDELVLVSPDGLVEDDGMIEIKSVNDANHFALILEGEKGIDSKYMWQMQMNLLVSERKWIDYVSYNPNFKQSLVIFRIFPDKAKQDKLISGIEKGKAKIREIKEKYGN